MKAVFPKRKTPAGQGEGFPDIKTSKGKCSSASTAKQAQLDRIVKALARRPHNSHELRELGVYQVSARIKELRELGHSIQTDKITLYDAWGYEHRGCALYTLGAPS